MEVVERFAHSLWIVTQNSMGHHMSQARKRPATPAQGSALALAGSKFQARPVCRSQNLHH